MYFEQIDPIGESDIINNTETMQSEHDLICNVGTSIERMKYEIKEFDSMIGDYETYSDNTLFINKLKNLKQRLKVLIGNVDVDFNSYVDLTTPKIEND